MNPPTVRVKVSGDLALFTRPENKVERVSYETLTPSAARNILDAICWRPQMRWVVRRVLTLNPIRFQSIRRNEVQSKIAPGTVQKWMKDPSLTTPQWAGAGEGSDGTPRNSLVLRDVAYIVEAYAHVYFPNDEDTPIKYAAMLNRRVEKGQCYTTPYLGVREFPARFEAANENETARPISLALGRMLYDIIFRPGNNRAVFFDARLDEGVLETDPARVLPDALLREELLACSYKR